MPKTLQPDLRSKQPEQVKPYSPHDPLTHGVDRGRWLFHHLESALGGSLGRELVDIGCGYGGLSIAWANQGKRSIAVEKEPRNVAVVIERLRRGEAAPGCVTPIIGSALALPLADKVADLALMMGVLEWVGYSDPGRQVRDLQLAALKESARVLRPGGILALGTKNRLFPRYVWSDAQLHRPLVNVLPRGFANWVSTQLWNLDYRGYVYTYAGWKSLVEAAGFARAEILVPIFNYQFPLVLAKPWRPVKLNGLCHPGQASEGTRLKALKSGSFGRTAWYRAFGRLGLLGLAAGSFLIVCRRS